jgi:predicted HAD superfamily Cof-like phosphohydrolase
MHRAVSSVREFMRAGRQHIGDMQAPAVPTPSDSSLTTLSSVAASLRLDEGRLIGPGDGPDDTLLLLRARLVVGETAEFVEALAAGDLVETADAIADLVYVTVGAAIAFGIDLPAVFDEVHRSNMAKFARCTTCRGACYGPSLGVDGANKCATCDGVGLTRYMDPHGKITKPPGWTPPDVAGMLQKQRDEAPL